MLPSTRYAILGLGVLAAVIAYFVAPPDMLLTWVIGIAVVTLVVAWVWNAIRQAQVDLEWQKRIQR
jgi:uncharacterized membrane protein YkvA (DUF1232 family)